MAIVPPKCQKLYLYSHVEHLILTPHTLSNKWGQGMLVVGTHCAPWLTSAFMRESTSLSRAVVMVSTDEQGVWGSHKSALFCYLVPSKPWQRTQTLLLWYYCGPTPYLLAQVVAFPCPLHNLSDYRALWTLWILSFNHSPKHQLCSWYCTALKTSQKNYLKTKHYAWQRKIDL